MSKCRKHVCHTPTGSLNKLKSRQYKYPSFWQLSGYCVSQLFDVLTEEGPHKANTGRDGSVKNILSQQWRVIFYSQKNRPRLSMSPNCTPEMNPIVYCWFGCNDSFVDLCSVGQWRELQETFIKLLRVGQLNQINTHSGSQTKN